MPPDVESKLVDFCIALRSLNFPIFKEELLVYCNNLIQGTTVGITTGCVGKVWNLVVLKITGLKRLF